MKSNGLRRRSYIELTDDNIIVFRLRGFKPAAYPVAEIEKIAPVDFASEEGHKLKRECMFPIEKGNSMMPESGVLIYFRRQWIKSVRPVFFNPADTGAFIHAVTERVDRTESVN